MRYFYLDNLRAFLMVLGLVLHTCAAFSPSKYWLVSYVKPIEWVDTLNDFIHLFRMPLFFMISGFFAFLMMEKQSTKTFCSTKLLRIGIPFLTVLLVVNLPQYFSLEYLNDTSISDQINTNSFVGHLWFLVNLLVYFLLYSVMHKFIQIFNPLLNKLATLSFISLAIVIIPVGYLGILGMNKIGIPIYENFLLIGSLYKLFSYFDYFILGVLFARLGHDKFISALKSIRGMFLILVLFIVSTFPWSFPIINNELTIPYINHIQAIFVCLLVWLFATKLMNYSTGMFKQLASASYSIYLFHHVMVVGLVLAANLLNSSVNIVIDPNFLFFLIITLTLFGTNFIHTKIIMKYHVFSLFFNGKPFVKG